MVSVLINTSSGIEAEKVNFSDPVAMGYNILKALPEMADAVDVLEEDPA